MSKFISVFHRHPVSGDEMRRRLTRAMADITPDIIADTSRIETDTDTNDGWATLNWPDSFARHGMSLCQGKLYEAAPQWWETGTPIPDGSFAMIRADAARVEAICDIYGSRSLFIYHDDELLALSNSQRALTLYTGRFAPNKAVAPWLMAGGSLGPDQSYNAHLRLLPPDSQLRLDRATWQTETRIGLPDYASDNPDEADNLAALDTAIAEVMRAITPQEAETMTLALSGGYDSRAICSYLHQVHPGIRWRSFTGGAPEAEANPQTDAAVAARLADHYGCDHSFVPDGQSREPMTARLERFVMCSEGRVDHFKGYANGMVQLRELHETGQTLILRGDQCMGSDPLPEQSDLGARLPFNALLCTDIPALARAPARFGWPEHVLPERIARTRYESLNAWRDRFQRQVYAPYVLTALNETKAPFFDVLTPLSARRIIKVIETLPTSQRSDKALFRKLVRRKGPDLPFAQGKTSNPLPDFLKDPQLRAEVLASLESPAATELFGTRFIAWLKREIAREANPVHKAIRVASRRLRSRLSTRGITPPIPRPIRYAFRVYLGSRMIAKLQKDAEIFGAFPQTGTAPARATGSQDMPTFKRLAGGSPRP